MSTSVPALIVIEPAVSGALTVTAPLVVLLTAPDVYVSAAIVPFCSAMELGRMMPGVLMPIPPPVSVTAPVVGHCRQGRAFRRRA